MLNDYGYIDAAIANIKAVAEKQEANIKAAATLMADAIAADKLINVYAGGGHTTLAMGEMFFRAGGVANINPINPRGQSPAGNHDRDLKVHDVTLGVCGVI